MKTYRVRLYIGGLVVGTFEVKAYNKESAYEMAWELAQQNFHAEIID